MRKKIKVTILVLAMMLGIIGTSTVALASESFKHVNASSTWTTIATNTEGFNCNVKITGYSSGTITVTNCTLDQATYNSGVSFTPLSPKQSPFINGIKCTEADICEAEYDEYGTLKPNIPDEGNKDDNKNQDTYDFWMSSYFRQLISNQRNVIF